MQAVDQRFEAGLGHPVVARRRFHALDDAFDDGLCLVDGLANLEARLTREGLRHAGRWRVVALGPVVLLPGGPVPAQQVDARGLAVVVHQHEQHVAHAGRAIRAQPGIGGGQMENGVEIAGGAGLGAGVRRRDRQVVGDDAGALPPQRHDVDATGFEDLGGFRDPRQRVHEVLEQHFARAVGAGDVVGMIAAGEQDLVHIQRR